VKESVSRFVKPVHFEGPEGRLEGLWDDPGRGLAPGLILHPHPAHGGSMHSKVVYTVFRVLHEAGHPTLRFNFRGVGASQGSYSGWDGEVGDVAAAAAFVRRETGMMPIWLAGFSFGSWVGSKWALSDPSVERMILLGVPVDRNVDNRSFEHLTKLPAPTLIIQGERDKYGSPASVESLGERLRAFGKVLVRVVPGADHFFTGKLTLLEAALQEGLASLEGA
jgi:alpha/beta superfamily hydrolase